MMNKKLFSLFVDVESLPFWLDRPILRKRMKQLFKYVKILEAEKVNQTERIEEFEAENDKFRDALIRIDNWAKAYPCNFFPKPDLKKAARLLKAAGMTLDAISADAMRHVIDGVKDITEQALK